MKIIYITLLLSTLCNTVFSQTGKVISVADGDTFTMLIKGNEQKKVRLQGIDCPEKNQDFGQVAKKFTSDLIYGKVVTINSTGVDRYGRTIAIVYIPGGKNLNEELLRNGLAWHYFHYDKNPEWARLEKVARNSQVGLWRQPNPVAPWNFRRNRTFDVR